MCCQIQFVSILLRIFVSVFIRYMRSVGYFYFYIFIRITLTVLLYQDINDLIKINWKFFPMTFVLEEFAKDLCYFLINYLIKFTSEAIWYWLFFVRFFKIVIMYSLCLQVIGLFSFSISTLVSFGSVFLFYFTGLSDWLSYHCLNHCVWLFLFLYADSSGAFLILDFGRILLLLLLV